MQIVKTCLRYVLPFYYSCAFNEAVKSVNGRTAAERSVWLPNTPGINKTESDLFAYIREENCFEADQSVSEGKSGVSWLHRESVQAKGNKRLLTLMYFEKPVRAGDEALPPGVQVTMNNLGLVLYKNHLGFLWYELEIPDGSLSPEGLLLFQNRIKELNRASAPCYFWEKCQNEPECGIVYDKQGGRDKYITPLLLGKWLGGLLSFLPVRYFAERDSAYEHLMEKAVKATAGLPFERKGWSGVSEACAEKLPDKALLFSYTLLKQEEDPMPAFEQGAAYTYRLANGYQPSYILGQDIVSQIRQPFGNAFWFASQEGAAYTAWALPENEQVFKSDVLSKVRVDYFTLYLKVLYQSFSLLIYAERIQREIPADLKEPAETSFIRPVTDLLGEISLFLTRSMATSVSHIHHQSAFYIYLKQQLRIKEDIESVTAGMNALEVLMREQAAESEKQRDYRMQAILAMFALLGVFSALADCKGFFDHFASLHGLYIVLIVGILVVSAITLSYVIVVFSLIWKDRKNRNASGGKK